MSEEEKETILHLETIKCNCEGTVYNFQAQVILNLIKKQQAEIEKKDKIIDLMLQEFTDCEFELKCSECCCECEKDYDQLYECNKQYFEKKVNEK